MPSLSLAAKRRWYCSATDKAAQSSRAATHVYLAGKCESASVGVCFLASLMMYLHVPCPFKVDTCAQCSPVYGISDCNASTVCDRSGKTLLAMALLMAGTLTAAANVWGVKRINSRMLRQVGPQASELLGREVSITNPASHMPCHPQLYYAVSALKHIPHTYLESGCWTSSVNSNR